MAYTQYPTDFKQCFPTSREEQTGIISQLSENGTIRGRDMYSTPVYVLSLTHDGLTKEQLETWDIWWAFHKSDEIEIVWGADNVTYVGIFQDSPSVDLEQGLPFNNFRISTSLLVKRKSLTTVTTAIAGTPGSFEPDSAVIPYDLSTLISLGSLGNTTAWTTGEYVVLGDSSNAYWNGSTWVAGTAS